MSAEVPSYPALRLLLGLYDTAAHDHRWLLSSLHPLAARLSLRPDEVRALLGELLRLQLVQRPTHLPLVRLSARGAALAARMRQLIGAAA